MKARDAVDTAKKEPVANDDALTQASAAVKVQAGDDRSSTRRKYGPAILLGAGFQIAIADGGFLMFAHKNDWHVSDQVMIAWLSATVVQVVAVVFVIAREVFSADR